ncbi:DUF4394 domain-containing protein [Streptosporangium sp. NPDC023615]|uniref:DUF4394 domain-containing protein n=1 Tax=Streptosporangium sp. NPDC023615 TaxID=3154794 RepID=UPI00341C3909
MRRTLAATVLALSTAASVSASVPASVSASVPAQVAPARRGATGSLTAITAENTAENAAGREARSVPDGGTGEAAGGGRFGGRGGAAGNAGRAKVGIGVVGLTSDQRLVAFDIRFPGRVRDLGGISGLQGDTGIVGIDYRVRGGELYGVGDQGGVYTLGGAGKATKVSQLTVALSGSAFGVDFDPAADVLRVVGDTGQNLRHDLEGPVAAEGPTALTTTGRTVADRPLTTTPVPPATAPVAAPGVSGIGYTNNDLSAATATALFDVDTTTDRLGLQSPADAGLLTPTGNLRVAVTDPAGFDVYSSLRGGVTVSNSAFATLKVAGRYRLYGLNLLTGAVNYNYGAFPAAHQVVDIAVRLDRR